MKLITKTFDELSAKELYEILKSRSEVFMLGQRIICQDMDDVDYVSMHFFYFENNRVCAYLRAFDDENEKNVCHIGRVLTLSPGIGIGKKLMNETMEHLAQKHPGIIFRLHSQKQAQGFYEKLGFSVVSDEFLEEGIAHVMMEKRTCCEQFS